MLKGDTVKQMDAWGRLREIKREFSELYDLLDDVIGEDDIRWLFSLVEEYLTSLKRGVGGDG